MTQSGTLQHERIEARALEEEMRESFIDYSMSVIVQRALPDARDGLKPVHRRILYAMLEEGLQPSRPHKKSATVVGDVLGRYHPHGDGAVYDTMVRMVQEFSLRYPLIDGQGNFGSIDGDAAAAYRYTEVRMTPVAVDLLADIDRDTVEMRPNFDGRLQEPEVLPCRLPHLLLNGSDGIAVGMATKIPPHNAVELLAAVDHLIVNPDCAVDELMARLPGPDFPTGGFIQGRQGIESAYRTGRGRIEMRARVHLEEGRFGKSSLIVTELPYQVNKARVIEQITKLVRGGRMDAITDLRDESDRDGIRLVIELKRDVKPDKVVAALFKKTQLRYTFGVIMLALVDGKPEELDLKAVLGTWVDHRLSVIRRGAAHDLAKAKDRAHLVEGLQIALDAIDRVIEIVRESRSPAEARERLLAEFELTELQADAILAMRLAQLTGLERDKLADELRELNREIERLTALVEDDATRRAFLRADLAELAARYDDPRRTEILGDGAELKLERGRRAGSQLVLVSRGGYIKSQSAVSGGGMAGAEALSAREGDYARHAFLAGGSARLLAVTARGNVHAVPVSELPRGTRSSRGSAIEGLLDIKLGDEIIALLPVESFSAERFLVSATRRGQIKRSALAEFANARAAGILGITVPADDEVVAAFLTEGGSDVVLATRKGQAIRFFESDIRVMGRKARGVRAISLGSDDVVVAAAAPRADADLLVATAGGHGKRIPFTELKRQGRGGKGLLILAERRRSGDLVAFIEAHEADDTAWELSDGSVETARATAARQTDRRGAGTPVIRLRSDVAVEAVHPMVSSRAPTTPPAPAADTGATAEEAAPTAGTSATAEGATRAATTGATAEGATPAAETSATAEGATPAAGTGATGEGAAPAAGTGAAGDEQPELDFA